MSRRYYALKVSLLVLAIALALGFEAAVPNRHHPMQDAHYQAADLMQTALRNTGAKLVHTVALLLTCPESAAL